MPIKVEIEGKGVVAEFPDGTDPAVIDAAIQRDFFNRQEQSPVQDVSLGEYTASPEMATSHITMRDAVPYISKGVEAGGLLFGAGIGAASPVPGGAVIGGGLGYGISRNISRRLEEAADVREPETLSQSFLSATKDVPMGAVMEVGGQIGAKALSYGVSQAGRLGRNVIGKLTGAGEGAAEEALRGSEGFTKAMRGKIDGEEIVTHAQEALSVVKESRAIRYQEKLAQLSGKGPVDTSPITKKTVDLLDKYNIRIGEDGTLDFSRAAIGKKGVRDLKGVWQTIKGWGTKEGDNTPLGLDTLKRQLDDFYSESSGARGFVASLRNTVRDTISKSSPEYSTMVKEYSDATKLIKDIESGLMLRKQGMSGRIVADQTLRRLMSAMRNNFSLRRDLMEALSSQGGRDITGEAAGYAMGSYVPLGLAGTGPLMVGQAAMYKFINPKLMPLLAVSSPRVSGEFLRLFGKYLRQMPGTTEVIGRGVAYGVGAKH